MLIILMQTQVNLIVYMNPNWKAEWGGQLNIYNGTLDGMTTLATKIQPDFNTAALFCTSDASWHGFPDPLQCPLSEARKSVAIYYVSEPRESATNRTKAKFLPCPTSDDNTPGYLELCRLRESRLLTPEDMHAHTPEWQNRWK